MSNLFLPLAVALLGLGTWGFYKNRTALRNVVIFVAGIVVLCAWIADVTGATWLFLVMGALLAVAVLFSLPILVTALLLNGLVMVQKEARTLGNMLSLLVGILILVMVWSFQWLFGVETPSPILGWVWIGAALVLSYFAVAFVVFLVASALYRMVPVTVNPKYGIILGARLIDGKVPTLLGSRLDKGIELMENFEAQGQKMILIPTGGQGKDEIIPEGVGMAEYLYEKGVPPTRVIVEDKAVNTHQNLVLSRELMESPNSRCIVVTNDFHVFRTAMLARKIGLKTYVYGSKTKFYYLPSAVIREFLAILVQYKWLNLLVMGVLVAISADGLLKAVGLY